MLYKVPVFNIATLVWLFAAQLRAKQLSLSDVHSAPTFCDWNRYFLIWPLSQSHWWCFPGWISWSFLKKSFRDSSRSSVPYECQVTPVDLHQHVLLISTVFINQWRVMRSVWILQLVLLLALTSRATGLSIPLEGKHVMTLIKAMLT